MAFDVLKNVRIAGIASAVPKNIVSSEDYTDRIGEEAVHKFIDTVGIKQRHVGNGKITTSDLCVVAANQLFEEFQVNPDTIDALIFVSQTPDYIAPATACVLQNRLHLSHECLAYDVNLCCSGYVYGLHTAMSHMQSNYIKRVLLLVGDTASYTVSQQDKGAMMLFGDAGTATLLEVVEDESDECSIPFYLQTFGDKFKSLLIPYGGYRRFEGSHVKTERKDGSVRSDYDCYMNGPDVFAFSIMEVPKAIRAFYKLADVNSDKFDLVVFHQANKFILKNIAKRMKLEEGKLAFSIEEYGNTGSATIPLTLCHQYGDKIEELEQDILIAGFGIGLSLGVANITVSPRVCLPIKEVEPDDCCFDDDISELL